MLVWKKRGLSPVIATILLVSVTLVLAVVVFFWARTFIGENVQKQGRAIELLCDDVEFEADAYGGRVYIENLGNVPLNGVEIRKVGIGDITQAETVEGVGSSLTAGQTADFPLGGGIASGDNVIIIPILLGETSTEIKSHVCSEDYGLERVVDG